MRSQDFSSLRTAHHRLLLPITGFRLKDRTGYKPLSYREVLERTGSERIETTIWKRQLGFAGALVRQGDSRLSKRVMFGRLAVQGPKRGVDRRRRGCGSFSVMLASSGIMLFRRNQVTVLVASSYFI